jgi:hypothetical protein
MVSLPTDSFVQVNPDSTGKKVDTSEITRLDGTIVERQRIVLVDPLTSTNVEVNVIDKLDDILEALQNLVTLTRMLVKETSDVDLTYEDINEMKDEDI